MKCSDPASTSEARGGAPGARAHHAPARLQRWLPGGELRRQVGLLLGIRKWTVRGGATWQAAAASLRISFLFQKW